MVNFLVIPRLRAKFGLKQIIECNQHECDPEFINKYDKIIIILRNMCVLRYGSRSYCVCIRYIGIRVVLLVGFLIYDPSALDALLVSSLYLTLLYKDIGKNYADNSGFKFKRWQW